MTKKEVTKKENTNVVEVDFLDELTQDADTYQETLSQDDMAMPFLVLLQALSPMCTEGDPAYVEGSRPGMGLDTTDGTMFDIKKTPLIMVAVAYKSSFIEWVPRSTGQGGFVKEHATAAGLTGITVRNDDNEDIIQANSPVGQPGNQLTFTHTHFVLVQDPETGAFNPYLLTMAISQLKHSKKFNRMVNNLKVPGTTKPAPRFFGVWALSSQLETKGENKWQSWAFKKHSDLSQMENGKEVYKAAKKFSDSLNLDEIVIDHGRSTAAEDNPEVGDDVPVSDTDEEIPF